LRPSWSIRGRDVEGAYQAADGLVGADQVQHVHEASRAERVECLLVDGLIDAVLGCEPQREPVRRALRCR